MQFGESQARPMKSYPISPGRFVDPIMEMGLTYVGSLIQNASAPQTVYWDVMVPAESRSTKFLQLLATHPPKRAPKVWPPQPSTWEMHCCSIAVASATQLVLNVLLGVLISNAQCVEFWGANSSLIFSASGGH